MNNQDLVDFLKEFGVCEICQLRYLKARGNEYKNIQESFERLNVKYDENPFDEIVVKKSKPNVCPTCLGLFDSEFQRLLVEEILKANIENYECNEIVVAMCLPMVLQIRQLSMWYALLNKFPASRISASDLPEVPLKEAIKLIINPIIVEKLNKTYDANGIMINITLKHNEEENAVKDLGKLQNIAFSCKGKQPEISRGLLEKQYSPAQLKAETFQRFFPIPPSIPDVALNLHSLTLAGPTVFVAGRYRKLSRCLSHTPWILNGVRMMEDSIEEILIRNIAEYFCEDVKRVIFMSSGREDVDVRCLGKGRPFVLEIPNSKKTTLSKSKALEMEKEIDKSGVLSVHNLQMVKREDLVHIKMGEEKKRKFYRAVCVLKKPASVEILEKLNLPQGFEIQQKTPIRVLHRRPLHTRPRTIYSLKTMVNQLDKRVLVLDMETQAGTYIKELVHGDLGRTIPSIYSMIGQEIDIQALDVVGIDLDWPAEIDNAV